VVNIFFRILMTFALECGVLTPLYSRLLDLLMNRDTVISVLHIA